MRETIDIPSDLLIESLSQHPIDHSEIRIEDHFLAADGVDD